MKSGLKYFSFGMLTGFLVCLIVCVVIAFKLHTTKYSGTIQVHFSPKGGCAAECVEKIDNAKNEILIQSYSFTNHAITDALIKAHKRKVKIIAVIDKDQFKASYTDADDLINAGIAVYSDGRHSIAHNKIMIIDQSTLLTGSFNFTAAAENSNAENLLTIESADLCRRYIENFRIHLNHSLEVAK